MGTNVFISFRFDDGEDLKLEIEELFDSSTDVYNRSENVDRSDMSDDTIRNYLYGKLKETSVTIVLLTPNAVNYKKDFFGKYDDWLYDELRYSLQDREENRTNGVVALYTDESKDQLIQSSTHSCPLCNEEQNTNSVLYFDNLVRKNMMNIKDNYKSQQCVGLYDSDEDSYISLIHADDFKANFSEYIEKAKEKRDRKEEFELVKEM